MALGRDFRWQPVVGVGLEHCRVTETADGIAVRSSLIDEDDGGPTYSIVTARSYHPGGVQGLMGDGGVRFFKSTIQWNIWRALGTGNGGEVVSSDAY